MYPWEVTYIEWNKGTFTVRPLSEEEITRVVKHARFSRPGSHGNQNNILMYGAKVDDKMVVARAATEPQNEQEFSLLEWVELIPNGREVLTEEEHRKHVEKALVQGQLVPSKVLAAYPGLKRLQPA